MPPQTNRLDRPVAVVRTRSLQWEGEQTYIPLYADGTASGLGYEHDRDRQVTPPVRIGER